MNLFELHKEATTLDPDTDGFEDHLDDVYLVADELGFKTSKENHDDKKFMVLLTKIQEFGGLKVVCQYRINPRTHSWILQGWLADQDKSTAATLKSGEDSESLVHYMPKAKFSARRLVNALS